MSELKTLHSAIQDYLALHGWSVDEEHSTDMITMWFNQSLGESVQLPSANGLAHRRSAQTLQEALDDLSDILEISISDFKALIEPNTDHIHFRAAGTAIEHGRINFRTNHRIESAIYSIIKNTAESTIRLIKSANKKNNSTKSEIIESYLSCVNTVIPTGGSFIYNLDVDLKKVEEFDGSETLQRYVNSKLASAINELHSIRNVDQMSTAELIQKGLNESLCSSFVSMFDTDVETIECSFDWSKSEPAPKIDSHRLIFNRQNKEIIKKIKKKFNSSRSIPLKNAHAHLRRIEVKSEYATIRLKIELEGSVRTCDAEIDLDTAQRLMKTLGEEIKQPVMIDATAWIEKTSSKNHYSLSNITSICSEKGKNLSLLDPDNS
ncbi:hypothetical protein [Photobacterium ganghwense]|uniref:hypothetical protein n=1 Tax=Photobacterium ganghwense TaxID=320778 RepID=UPI001C2DE1C8|nr:hypothetical protein [Photobacterium ganghwense]MBV1842738.1 hypothetical protein [Photobacterium ganghwense]